MCKVVKLNERDDCPYPQPFELKNIRIMACSNTLIDLETECPVFASGVTIEEGVVTKVKMSNGDEYFMGIDTGSDENQSAEITISAGGFFPSRKEVFSEIIEQTTPTL